MLVLRGSEIVRDGTVEVHPAAAVTAKYCLTQIEQLLNNTLVQKIKGDVDNMLMLMLLVAICKPV